MSRENRSFEALESRQMLAVALSGFAVSDGVVAAGQTLTLSVHAAASAPDSSIRAATFFRDVNGNGAWDSGVDVDLGADFVGSGGGNYQRSITVPGNWTGTINLVADAVSFEGNWAGTRANSSVRANPRPSVSNFLPLSTFTVGAPLTLSSDATDDTSVRAVTWFIDRDLNGVWTAGLDTSLATSFTPTSGNTYSVQVTPDSSWPRVVQLISDAQDNDLDWSATAADGTTTQLSSSRPAVTNLVASKKYASLGAGMVQLSVDASDNSAVYLATYFVDFDSNGAWTPFADQDLGQTYMSSQSGTYTRTITTDFAGKAGLQFAADAQDFDGLYASSRATTTITNDTVTVTGFALSYIGAGAGANNDFGSKIGLLAPATFGRTGTVSVNVNYFVDLNNNNLYDAGTDLFVVSQSVSLTRGTELTITPTLAIPAAQGTTPQLCVFVTDAGDDNEISTVRIAANRADLVTTLPDITAVTTTLGSVSTFAVAGSAFSISADWSAPAGGLAVTFFFDRNSNGRWDTGIDTDLGFNTVTGTSGTSTLNGTISAGMVGWGQFAAAVHDVTARGNDSWSAPHAQSTQQVFQTPSVSNGNSPIGVAGSPVVVDFDATDDFGIRAATGFIDINGNGLFDAGTDSATVGTSYSPLSGSMTSGRWRLVIQTTGLSAGTYTIYVAATDFYQGDASAAGGVTNGFWSSRLAITLTLA